jgi:hypothetical protein
MKMEKTMTIRLRTRALGLSLARFLVIALLLIVQVQGNDPYKALAAGQNTGRPGEVRPVEGFTVFLPLAMNGYDPFYMSPFGVVMYGDVDASAGLQKMEDAGSGWVTTALHWSAIEPTRGAYDWSSFDAKAQNAQAAGMNVFVLFTGNPSWAAPLPGGPVNDIRDLVDLSTLMAERYDCDGVNDAPGSPCVHYWSFYAEPDNGDLGRAYNGKGYWGHNGAGYAAMLSHISPAMHSANPNARVLIGGIAYDYFEPGGPFVRSFLADTLRALNTYSGGAGAYIDGVAFHYYPISSDVWPSIRQKALEVRGIMDRYSAGHLPLICPEMGYWSAEGAGSSEAGQARRLVRMYVRGLAVGLEYMSWYTVFDASPERVAQYPSEEHGLFPWQDLSRPKQSYYAYQALVRELDRAHYLRELRAANVEGYVFEVPGGREKTVLWATTTSSSVSFTQSCVNLVHVLGYSQTINDGGSGDADGRANGQILVQVSQDIPVYVAPCD